MECLGETTDDVGVIDVLTERANVAFALTSLRRFKKFRSVFGGAPKAKNNLSDLVRIKHPAAVRAGELRLIFEPTSHFLETVSALAREGHGEIGVTIRHGWPILYLRESQFLRWTKAGGASSAPGGGSLRFTSDPDPSPKAAS